VLFILIVQFKGTEGNICLLMHKYERINVFVKSGAWLSLVEACFTYKTRWVAHLFKRVYPVIFTLLKTAFINNFIYKGAITKIFKSY
jgi:hypothetical protein